VDRNKKEIVEFLTTEIIGRYYYQKGSIKSSLQWDKDVEKALKILSDQKEYTAILHVADQKVVAVSN